MNFFGVDCIKKIAIALIMTLIIGLLPSCSIGSVVHSINTNNNKGLEYALGASDIELVNEAVEAGADVNKNLSIFSGPEASPLWYSIREGQRFIPAYLLSKGADPNFVNDQGISILMFTVGANAESGITYANAEDNDSYKTLLNDKRTKINLKGKLGFTALDYACRDSGNLDKVNYLISHGAIITATTMKCAINGYSDGHCDPPVLKLVLDSLIKQGIPSGLDPEIEAAILGDSNKLLSLYNEGKIKQQNMQMVQFLTAAFGDASTLKALTAGVDLNNNFNYETLLSTASEYGKLETVEYLVSQNVKLETTVGYYNYNTALTMAIEDNRLDIAKLLQKSDAKFQTQEDSNVENALEYACENGNLDMIKWIIDSGYTLTTNQKVGALTYAAQNNRINVLKYLLNVKKSDINATSFQDGVLEDAIWWDASLDTIKFLVDNGANINGGENQYSTPFSRAVQSNRADVAKYLIEKGADVNLAGINDGCKDSRPLTEAIQTGLFDMVKLLIDNGASLSYHEGWSGGDDSPLDIAKAEGSKRILAYIEAAEKSK
jgi:ankyrin repeat protein